MAETDSHFAEIKNAILKAKEKSTIEKSGQAITLSFSGLIYSATAAKEESITFKALDLDFIIKSDGEILMMELEDGEVNFYELEEGVLKDSLREFLVWRAKVIADVGI